MLGHNPCYLIINSGFHCNSKRAFLSNFNEDILLMHLTYFYFEWNVIDSQVVNSL